ncbi:Cytochrome c-551 precursor [compost metagenome]
MKKLTTAGLLLTLAVGLAACGGGDKPSNAPAEQNQSQSATTSAGGDDAMKIMQGKCMSCHGQELKGGVGPGLTDVGSRLSKDEIAKVVKDGRAPGMPGGLISNEKELEAVATYLSEQK